MNPKGTELPRIIVVFRNDDPSALMDLEHESRIFGLFEKYQVPQTIGVIPCVSTGDQHSKLAAPTRSLLDSEESIQFLKDAVARTGSEIALHGYCHQTNRFSKPSRRHYFEFQKIPLQEQHDLIEQGTAILTHAFGRRPRTFIPPWNRHDQNTLLACRSLEYRVISAGAYTRVADGLLGFGANCCFAGFSHALEQAKKTTNRVYIHVLFHSATVRKPDQVRCLESVLKTVQSEPSCIAMTISEVASNWPDDVQLYNIAGRNVVPLAAVEGNPRSRIWPYFKAMSYVSKSVPFEPLRSQAVNSYLIGDYTDSIAKGDAFDRACTRGLGALRMSIFILSAGSSWILLALWNLRGDWTAAALPSIVAVQLLIAGWAGGRAALATQTGREIFLGSLLAAAGMISAALGLWVWFGFTCQQLK